MKEIVKWVIISEYEGATAVFDTEKEALTSASFVGKTKIVKMVGPMPEQKKTKKVATYAYRYEKEVVTISGVAITEEKAKKVCKDRNWELIKWPYGDVIELEVEVEKMKRCEICKHYDTNHYAAPCVVCANTTDLPKWELEE